MTPEVRLLQDPEELDAAIAVRRAVFVDEQGGPTEDEPDEEDATATHFGLFHGGELIGTARLVRGSMCKIGRVCVIPEYRGRGWGALLMRAVLRHAAEAGYWEAVLHAQAYACDFYKRLGFTPAGDVFDEAGIPHQRMERRFTAEDAEGAEVKKR